VIDEISGLLDQYAQWVRDKSVLREVNDQYVEITTPYLDRHNVVASLFLEDVTAWLELHDIRFTPNVKFTGRSGYDHTFDFVVPASRRAPERLIRAVNRPSRDLAESLAFSWVDTKEVRPSESRCYAFLNDENRAPSTTIVDALRSYDIVPVIWSDRDGVRQELAA
jgi:uncharacterized protein DUF1829